MCIKVSYASHMLFSLPKRYRVWLCNIMSYYSPSISVPVTQKDTSKTAGVEDSAPSKEANFEDNDSPDGPAPTGNGL